MTAEPYRTLPHGLAFELYFGKCNVRVPQEYNPIAKQPVYEEALVTSATRTYYVYIHVLCMMCLDIM